MAQVCYLRDPRATKRLINPLIDCLIEFIDYVSSNQHAAVKNSFCIYRSAVVAIETGSQDGSGLLFVKGGPGAIKRLISPEALPDDYMQVLPCLALPFLAFPCIALP